MSPSLTLVGAVTLAVGLLQAGPAPPPAGPIELPKRHATWLEEVDPIISGAERRLFLQLSKDYQRDAFIRKFWQVRDPFPETGRNEARERFEERLEYARANYGGPNDDRSRILVVHGEPARVVEVRCTTTRKPAEIWLYVGSETVPTRFLLVFLRPQGLGPARLWHPGRSGPLEHVISSARGCINGHLLRDVANQIRGGGNYDSTMNLVLLKPRPRSEEWVSTFATYSTDLPADAERFAANTTIDYLGRHQQRTVVQGVLEVPIGEAQLGDFGGYRSYNFLLTGEVVRDGQLFESFRYKFGLPELELAGVNAIPIAFQRYLRPGAYQAILKLEDLNSGRFFWQERNLTVPRLQKVHELPPPADPEVARLFAEATESVEIGETDIRIVPPVDDLQTGFVRIDTLATGAEIEYVLFHLDGRQILRKNRPPYSVEIDLGPFPTLHVLRVEALDAGDRLVADDDLLLNAGGQRFSLRLLEPRRGVSYSESLRARAEIQVPENRSLQRVELFLNETLVATLYQEPWVQPITLPQRNAQVYVRAVAYLTDGNSTEDLVFVNSPHLVEEVEVQFVELFASVSDREGRRLSGLEADDFTVIEDGIKQEVVRFERVNDLPIHVGVLIDNSASMRGALEVTREAALQFFERSIHPRDRAAVITFNRFPNVAVKLTNDITLLGSGLAGLTAEGQTALYDSLMFTMYYFTGITGQRAVLLLSDGKDEVSRFDFADTLEYARRAGVTVYAIGLQIAEPGARRKLVALADETGGESYFIRDPQDLDEIYTTIQEELRSQYLIAYQSTNTQQESRFRSIEVKVNRSGAVVKTMSGYYP